MSVEAEQKLEEYCLGTSLEARSLEELEADILRLRQEIVRVEQEISRKKLTLKNAQSVFKT